MANTQRDRSTTAGKSVQPQKLVGRPRGAPSTIVNVRLSLTLLAQLDRYLDRVTTHADQTANRAMLIRRALAEFLERQDIP